MAAKSPEEEKAYFPGVMDGTKKSTVNFSCFELIKPSFDKTKEYCSLDVLPILIDEAPFPVREKCNFNSSRGQDDCSIPVLPEEGNVSPQHTSPLTFLSFLGLRLSSKNQMCLDTRPNCQNCTDSQMQNEDAYSHSEYSPSILNVNVEKESSEVLKSNDEMVGSTKSEGVMTHFQKVLQRQASLSTDKSLTERVHDAPTNRWKRYKRAASFDSRKVVILFSILSSVGTLILIYLTLRVRQTADGFNHV
ncbi:hypothetical protein SLA2020_083100 [Shorea laevis]